LVNKTHHELQKKKNSSLNEVVANPKIILQGKQIPMANSLSADNYR